MTRKRDETATQDTGENPVDLFLPAQSFLLAAAQMGAEIEDEKAVVLVTGPKGAGVSRLLEFWSGTKPSDIRVAEIREPEFAPDDVIEQVLSAFDLKSQDAGRAVAVSALRTHLIANLSEDQKTVLVIDNADRLSSDALDLFWMLASTRHQSQALLHVILAGSSDLADRMKEQAQGRRGQAGLSLVELGPLDAEECATLFETTVKASFENMPSLSGKTLEQVYAQSQGRPGHVLALVAGLARQFGAVAPKRITAKDIVSVGEGVTQTVAQVEDAPANAEQDPAKLPGSLRDSANPQALLRFAMNAPKPPVSPSAPETAPPVAPSVTPPASPSEPTSKEPEAAASFEPAPKEMPADMQSALARLAEEEKTTLREKGSLPVVTPQRHLGRPVSRMTGKTEITEKAVTVDAPEASAADRLGAADEFQFDAVQPKKTQTAPPVVTQPQPKLRTKIAAAVVPAAKRSFAGNDVADIRKAVRSFDASKRIKWISWLGGGVAAAALVAAFVWGPIPIFQNGIQNAGLGGFANSVREPDPNAAPEFNLAGLMPLALNETAYPPVSRYSISPNAPLRDVNAKMKPTPISDFQRRDTLFVASSVALRPDPHALQKFEQKRVAVADELARLNGTKAALAQDLAKLDANKQALARQVELGQKALDTLQEAARSMASEEASREARLAELATLTQESQDELKAARADNATFAANLGAATKAAALEKERISEETDVLREELAELRAQTRTTTQALSTKATELAQTEAAFEKVQADLSEAQSDREALTLQIASLGDERTGLEAELEASRSAFAQLSTQQQDQVARLAQTRQFLTAAQAEFAKVTAETETQTEELETKIAAQQSDLENARALLATARSELAETNSERDAQVALLGDLVIEARRAENELVESRLTARQLEETRLSQLQNLNALNERTTDLALAHDEAWGVVADLEARAVSLEEERALSQAVLEGLDTEIAAKRADASALGTELAALAETMTSRQTALAGLQEAQSSLTLEVAALRETRDAQALALAKIEASVENALQTAALTAEVNRLEALQTTAETLGRSVNFDEAETDFAALLKQEKTGVVPIARKPSVLAVTDASYSQPIVGAAALPPPVILLRRSETDVRAAMPRIPGIGNLSREKQEELTVELIRGTCIPDALQQVVGKINRQTLRALLRRIDRCTS